jgi:hypothetical protein
VEQVEGGRARLAPKADRHRTGEPGDGVDLGEGGGELGAGALREAPGDDEASAVTAAVGEGQDRLHRLAARLLDEGTGVHDHEIGVGGVARRSEAVGEQGPGELVGVDLVLGAAQGLDPERAAHGDSRLVPGVQSPGSRGTAPGASASDVGRPRR